MLMYYQRYSDGQSGAVILIVVCQAPACFRFRRRLNTGGYQWTWSPSVSPAF